MLFRLVLLFMCFTFFGLKAQNDSTLIKSYNRVVEEYRKKGYQTFSDEETGYVEFRKDIYYRIKFHKPLGKVNPRNGGSVRVKEITLIINDQGKVLKKKVKRYREENISG